MYEMYGECVCVWSSSRLARSLNRGVAADFQWHHRALKLTYWPLGSSLGHTTPTAGCSGSLLSTLSFQSFMEPRMQPPSIYMHLLWNIVFVNCRIKTVLIRKMTALVVSSNTWSEMLTLSWQPKSQARCCLNTTKPLRAEVRVDAWV